MPLTARPAVPADVEPLLALVDGVIAWLVARGRSGLLLDVARSRAADLGVALALDHWSGSPELAALYERAGFVAAGGFTLDRDVPWPGTVRVLRR